MGINSGIEHLGMHISGMVNNAPVGYMSPLTALFFILAGLAFLSLLLPSDRPWYSAAAFWLAFLTVLTSSSLLFAYFLGVPFLYGGSVIPPALPTSLAFLVLGAGLLFSSWQRAVNDGETPDAANMRAVYVLVLIFVFLAAGTIISGYLYFRAHEKHYRGKVEQELSAIKELKVAELAQWRKERLDDAAILFRNASFSELVQRYFNKEDDPEARRHLLEWISKFQGIGEFNQVRLMDLQGATRLSVPGNIAPASIGELRNVSEVIQSGQPSITDFYRSDNDRRIYLAVKIPILNEDGSRPLAILSVRIDPEKYLYPLIQSWPTPSRTGETLLVRRDGDEVIFLNELRHRKDTAFSLRFPLSKKELPAAMAVLGTTGVVEGVDYRGVPVIVSIGPIPDSPWFIVSKVDEDEIYAPMRAILWAVVIVVGLLILGSGLGIGVVWRQQRAHYYKEQYKAELQLNLEREKSAEEIRKYTEELKRSNKELQQFAYIASHDLQEPLRMIASYLQLIERRYKGNLDKDADEFIAFAVDGANRLQEMIIGLLAYSRVETKGKPLAVVNSAEVLGNAVANLKLVIEESGALVTAETLPVIRADASQLLLVFQNLISNAIKFRGKDAPLIYISAEQKKEEWVFAVKDNGVGIEPEYKEKVFDMFQRLHGRKYPGVGIGLSLCRRIIERHKGRIWFESETGKGATFYFTIPIKEGEKNE
ncbi:MAG: GHKL domain-containing protein [Nitrospirae bacterium]|nr:GHKL domain-containing protein [Nitrospirota bacterium]